MHKISKIECKVLKKKLVGFNWYTIYRVNFKKQDKVIRVKDLQIYKDTSAKYPSNLRDFDGKLSFDGIQLTDKEKHSPLRSVSSNNNNRDKEYYQRPLQSPVKRQKLIPAKMIDTILMTKPNQMWAE